MTYATVKWSPERVNILRTMWAAGDTASTIGAALGVTRNCVIGKAHRMGLAARK